MLACSTSAMGATTNVGVAVKPLSAAVLNHQAEFTLIAARNDAMLAGESVLTLLSNVASLSGL
jgi:hypothetical protein